MHAIPRVIGFVVWYACVSVCVCTALVETATTKHEPKLELHSLISHVRLGEPSQVFIANYHNLRHPRTVFGVVAATTDIFEILLEELIFL